MLNWTVAIEGSDLTPFIRFALEVNGEVFSPIALPVSVGLISGSSLVVLAYTNTKVSLINNTGDTVRLADVAPIANLVISKV